jgi:ABC-type multidrug transport system ATPase subunit
MQLLAARRQSQKKLPITVEGLSYSYKKLKVFDNLSFAAEKSTVILRGPSGCGKTTLLKLLSGNVQADRVLSMPTSENSCLVLQEDSLLPWLTGTQNIVLFAGVSLEKVRQHPMYEMIANFVGQKACRLSYGQRRLIELFRAIIYRPKYLYLDEPFNFLDEKRIELILPFLQGEFMSDTCLTLSNHHREDLSRLGAATVYSFDGCFPVTQLSKS